MHGKVAFRTNHDQVAVRVVAVIAHVAQDVFDDLFFGLLLVFFDHIGLVLFYMLFLQEFQVVVFKTDQLDGVIAVLENLAQVRLFRNIFLVGLDLGTNAGKTGSRMALEVVQIQLKGF